MRRLLFFTFLLLHILSYSTLKGAIPENVELVLKKSGKNRAEIEKAILYLKNQKSPLKLKALYFLIANMDIHYSSDYYWVDRQGKKIDFNEFAYSDFDKASVALNELRKRYPDMRAKAVTLHDIAFIKGDFLIANIEQAFSAWQTNYAKNISFDDFCEYILPYRQSVEPLQNWRETYLKKFGWITQMAKTGDINKTLIYTATDERNWFTDTWQKEVRSEPLPRLGALQLLFRKKGPCEDIADLEVFTLRSQGIPVALDIVPYWATSADGHFLNTVFDAKMHPINYDAMKTPPLNNALGREPSKVIRETYSKQPNVLANLEDVKNIPYGFMQTTNYKDVTELYWPTTTIKCQLSPTTEHHKIAYVLIFNNMRWRAAWWGEIKGNTVSFVNMSKGVVYLPTYFTNGKFKAAGYPIAEGYNHEVVLQPDLTRKKAITITEDDKYLHFQQGKKYRLFYWDNDWKPCGMRIPAPFSKIMIFDGVPQNALLLLRPEYSRGKERPFMITEDGKQVWW